jgi:Ni,Fe-hydrogenase I large subunit
MTRIVVDPVTRIAGHLRIELEVEGGVVAQARSSGTSFRGIENVLRGRDPRDAAHVTQRICGVCPISHGRAACEAFENAAQLTVPPQARRIRNIVQAANFIDSHLLHFYVLVLPDFVSGLPMATSAQLGSSPKAREGGKGLDAKLLAEHVAASVRMRRACHELIVALAGKMPHAAGIVPGGATVVPSATLLGELAGLATEIRAFVDGAYASDVQSLASAWATYLDLGASGATLLAFGAFPGDDGRPLLPAGAYSPQGAVVPTVDPAAIAESTASSRYALAAPAHPASGLTEPALDRAAAYSWIKAPRLAGQPCEVGPLARAILSGRDPGHRGVMARHLARQSEASVLAAALETWLAQLQPGVSALPVFPQVPPVAAGVGLTEAPRGALGHWLSIEASLVRDYGVVSPTTWNASPRDEQGIAGPIERALEGITLADPSDPIEAVRVVHSFDPCLACAVH